MGLSFSLDKDELDEKTISEVYVEYGFNTICRKSTHLIQKNKVSLGKNIRLNELSKFDAKIPISFPNIRALSVKTKYFVNIKTKGPNQSEKIAPKIYFTASKYKKHGINNIIDYDGLHEYILETINENKKEKEIDNKIYSHHTLNENKPQKESEKQVQLRTRFFSVLNYEKDAVEREFIEKLKSGFILFRISHFIMNSDIYRIIVVGLIVIPILISLGVNQIINGHYYLMPYIFKFLGIGVCLLVVSLIIQKYYKYILFKSTYDLTLHSTKSISKAINEKLKNGELYIHDIFKKFNIIDNSDYDYSFSVKLKSYISSYTGSGKDSTRFTNISKGIELFNKSGKGNFNIDSVRLLENDYNKIYDIMLPTYKKPGGSGVNGVSYKLELNIISSYFPDYKNEFKIKIDKKLDLSFNSKRLFLILFIFIVATWAIISSYLRYYPL